MKHPHVVLGVPPDASKQEVWQSGMFFRRDESDGGILGV